MAETHPSPAVVLLSGGLDSSTTLAIAQDQGFACHALSFEYGQRHRFELDAARRVVEHLGIVEHELIKLDPTAFAGSALTDEIEVPKDRPAYEMTGEIPTTYVPARNTIFLAYALGYAETIGSGDIFLGVNAVDFSGYPDCRPAFIEAFQRLANLATKTAVEGQPITIHAPLIAMTKAQIITRGLELGVDYSLTLSCYDPAEDGTPCGRCDSCVLRAAGFREAGIEGT